TPEHKCNIGGQTTSTVFSLYSRAQGQHGLLFCLLATVWKEVQMPHIFIYVTLGKEKSSF
ncbi:hypothetical protein, partial [Geomicrobium sp. JCM 19039]|uniref:hypothetical protein n=1 Tax=Geomicrobium sp. JCM 19039 TaxID=1460636 RepID=UPI001EE65C84